jgi:hypothetical protein
MQYKPIKNLIIGTQVTNISKTAWGRHEKEKIESLMRMGAQYKFSEKVKLSTELEKIIDMNLYAKVGVEYKPSEVFYLRCGMASKPTQSSCGVGIVFKNIKLDWAATYHAVLGWSTCVGVAYEFKKQSPPEK